MSTVSNPSVMTLSCNEMCHYLCWLVLLFLRNAELHQVINLTGYCSKYTHQKLIKVRSYLLPGWKLSVAAMIAFSKCMMTGCGYLLQAEGVFMSLLLIPHILQYLCPGMRPALPVRQAVYS